MSRINRIMEGYRGASFRVITMRTEAPFFMVRDAEFMEIC